MSDERKGADLGEFIRQQRERSRISLRKLADRAGISNPYLSQIERGLRRPSAEALKKIARALSISAESLYVRAGLLEHRDQDLTVPDSIQADPGLTARQKDALIEIYRTFVRFGQTSEKEDQA
jgi:transcriptional regulator with XRE-family HTH domain